MDGDLDGDMDGDEVVGRSRRNRGARRGGLLALPPKPNWRKGTITPGVQGPMEGLQPLPLNPDLQGGIFTATGAPIITFQARPQRPFQPLRLLASVIRTGTSAAALAAVCRGVFVGTDLQQLQLGSFNIEFFAPTAFDVGMKFNPAEAGIDIQLPINLTGGLTTTDTIAVQLLFLGHSIG
jgi:hypothetical protein